MKAVSTAPPGHVIDLMPTLLEVAGVEYPSEYDGHSIQPVEGKSLVPFFKGQDRAPHEYIFWEHIGNRAARKGPWKLVSEHGHEWELYNMANDPTELNNVIEDRPEIANDLKTAYENWAANNDVRDWPLESN